MIKANMTLGQVVLENPQVIETLNKMNIDFCCGGERTLEETSIEKDLDLNELIEKLNSIPQKETGELENAIELSSPELIDYIIDYHHTRELEMLNDIDPLLQKITRVHYQSHGEELTKIYKLYSQLKAELIPHFYQEEENDFPYFLQGNKMDIEKLIQDHEGAGALLDEMEDFTNGFVPPSDACVTYKTTFIKLKELAEDVHKHVFLENQVLFKRQKQERGKQ